MAEQAAARPTLDEAIALLAHRKATQMHACVVVGGLEVQHDWLGVWPEERERNGGLGDAVHFARACACGSHPGSWVALLVHA